MNSHELQRRIRAGDSEAFRDIYTLCGQRVYMRAQEAFEDADVARDIVKQVFLTLHHDIFSSDAPLDIDAHLEMLTDAEINTRRILAGHFDGGSFADNFADFAELRGGHTAPSTQPIPTDAIPAFNDPIPEFFEQAAPYRTPLERTQAYMEAEADRIAVQRRAQAEPEERLPKPQSGIFTSILIAVFLVLFIWLLLGVLMDFRILPRFDLGYRWFNETLFPLFTLAS